MPGVYPSTWKDNKKEEQLSWMIIKDKNIMWAGIVCPLMLF